MESKEIREHFGASRRTQSVSDERWLDALMGSPLDAIIVRTFDGAITHWNTRAWQMYGWTAEEAIGQPLSLTVFCPKWNPTVA